MPDSTLRKSSGYLERIQDAWEKPVSLTIPEGLVPPPGRLSKPLMQKSSELAECSSWRGAFVMPRDSISKRTGYNTRTADCRWSGERARYPRRKSRANALRRKYGQTVGRAVRMRRSKSSPEPSEAFESDSDTSHTGSDSDGNYGYQASQADSGSHPAKENELDTSHSGSGSGKRHQDQASSTESDKSPTASTV